MHFVTGGAFNGKSGWVKTHYQLNKENSCCWISGYHQDELPENLVLVDDSVVVLEGIEQWVKELLMKFNGDSEAVRKHWQELLQKWLQWESVGYERKVILIGSDITKGIVPALVSDREWRDATGRAYQDAVSVSDRVDLVWYGIGQRLK